MDREFLKALTRKVLEGEDKKWDDSPDGFTNSILAGAKQQQASSPLGIALDDKLLSEGTRQHDNFFHESSSSFSCSKPEVPPDLVRGLQLARRKVRKDLIEPFTRFKTSPQYDPKFTKVRDYMCTDRVNPSLRYQHFLVFMEEELCDQKLLFVLDCKKLLLLRNNYPKFMKGFHKLLVKFMPSAVNVGVDLSGPTNKRLVKLHNKYWRKGKLVPLDEVIND